MFFSLTSLRAGAGNTALIIAAVLMVSPLIAQTPELVVRAGQVWAPGGQHDVPIPIFMENYADTVAAFEIWLLQSNPDVFEFQIEGGVTRVTPLAFDTTGTLISGWQLIEVRSLGGLPHDARIVAMANTIDPPFVHGIGYPQTGDIPLIKLIADVYDISEITINNTAEILIMQNTDVFEFCDPLGNQIGVIYDTLVDTVCFMCTQWDDPPDDTICLVWEEVPGTTGDSCAYDTSVVRRLDTTAVEIIDGSLTSFVCGDVDGDGSVTMLDILDLIGIIYKGQPVPDEYIIDIYDIDSSGKVDMLDILTLITYLYKNGPEPVCHSVWI
jgi:hypothetical protein